MENRLFPPLSGPSTNPRGLLSPNLSEGPALLVAIAIGLVAVGLLENAMRAMPVPAGGDPGQWLSTSYAYVGLPYPSWIVPGQYPPLLFPLLGMIVIAAGGPIPGALTYVGVIAVLNGLSIYFLARSVTRHRTTALLAEALVLLNPTFLSMFFWGFYPNLLGFVFMNLCLGLFVRWIRSRRPWQLYLFWVCGAATILTHTLVGVVLIAVTGMFFLSAVGFRLIPREFHRSRAGWAGLGTFVGAVGGFYLGTALFTVPHPQYFQSGAFAYVRNGTASIFNLLVRPFAHGVKVSPASSVTLLWVTCTILILYVVGVRLFWKTRITLGGLLAASMALGPLLLPAIGWELAVVTDYSRFSYFLVAPIGLGVAVGLDWYLTKVGFRRSLPSTLPRPSALPDRRWAAERSRAGAAPGTVVLSLLVVVLVGISGYVAAASLPRDEKQTTQLGHDTSFLKALHMVQATGVPGSLLTIPGVAKWTRALLDRDAYFPNVEARFTFDPTHLIDEEEAYFALTSRYVADNGKVAGTALGTNLTDGNDTFEYQPSYYGSFTPVLSLPLGSLSLGVVHGGVTTSRGIDVGGVVRLHPVGPMSFSLAFIEHGFNVTVTVVVAPNAPLASFRITATADAGYGLRSLDGNLSGKGDVQLGNAPGSFEVTPGRYGQALATYVLVRPASALIGFDTGQHAGRAPRAGFRVTNPPGDLNEPLGVNFSFATVGASSLVPGLPPLITTDTTFANWSVRFVLYSNANAAGFIGNMLPHEISYLQSEYGAKILGRVGHWTVVMLPPPSLLPTAPWPVPVGAPP